jgi:hypothetical protein
MIKLCLIIYLYFVMFIDINNTNYYIFIMIYL